MREVKLDFVGIGAPKCGTTWIGRMLDAHPEIDFAKSKETFYFLDPDADVRSDVKGFRKTQDLASLANEFTGEGKIKGEYSTQYLFDENTLKNIYNHNPDIKILIAVRHPVEFLYSAFNYDKNSYFGNEVSDSFSEYVSDWSDKSLIRKDWANLSKYINVCLNIFPKENVFILHHENIRKNNREVLKSLYAFLDVDYNYVPDNIDEKINETRKFRNPLFRFLFSVIFNFVEFFRLEKFGRKLIHENQMLRSLMFNLFKKKTTKQALSNELLEELSKDYTEEIRNLDKYLILPSYTSFL